MSSSSSKKKSKKYFIKKSLTKGKLYLEVNQRGFLCSCNNRAKDCIKESYNLLNEYADKLYPSEDPQQSEENKIVDDDIEDSLIKEIANLKNEKIHERRFQVIDSGANNLLFIRTTLTNPGELVDTIIKDIWNSGIQKTKFLLRLIPIEVTCKANMNDIGTAFDQLGERHFKEKSLTFSIAFNHRNNNVISRDDAIKLIADRVFALRPDHKVDLKNPQVTIILEVIKAFAFLSVIPDYFKYKKYNLLSICNQEETINNAD